MILKALSNHLKSISNDRLLADLKTKVESERKLLMEILYALKEVEIRKLHLQMGYPDLYTFAMKELNYSAGGAYRRISAMRLLQSVPEVAPKLESGELGLENASQAQSFFRKEDQKRKEEGSPKLTLSEKQEVITELLGKSSREGQRVLLDRSPDVMMPTEKTRPLPDQKTLVQFVAGAELMQKLDVLKHLLAHKNYEGRLDVLVDQLADIALKELKPSQPAARSVSKQEAERERTIETKKELNPLDSSRLSPAPGMEITRASNQPIIKNRTRSIPMKERRKVQQRDQNGCTYQDPKTKRVCQSKYGLQYDHIKPFSQGGPNTAENLTIRCGAHNRYRAEQMGLGLSH